MNSQNFPVMTDLAQRLSQDTSGDLLKKTCKTIEARQDVVTQNLKQGLPPSQTQKARQEEEALQAAERITSIIWHMMHRQDTIEGGVL